MKKDIERFISRPLQSPADYILLSELLQKEKFGYISPTTLKRVWSYVVDKGDECTPSAYTLNTLAKYFGFSDILEYCSGSATIQSKEYYGEYIDTASLPADAEITIHWQPNHMVRLLLKGSDSFEVIANENSRLRVGDRVQCHSFCQHAPAFSA